MQPSPLSEPAGATKESPPPSGGALTRRDRFDARLGRLLLRAPARVQLALSGKPQIRLDGQKLDPGIQLALRMLELRGAPTLIGAPQNPEPAEVRARVRHEALMFSLVKTEVGDVR